MSPAFDLRPDQAQFALKAQKPDSYLFNLFFPTTKGTSKRKKVLIIVIDEIK
jgi:hypothetical protein